MNNAQRLTPSEKNSPVATATDQHTRRKRSQRSAQSPALGRFPKRYPIARRARLEPQPDQQRTEPHAARKKLASGDGDRSAHAQKVIPRPQIKPDVDADHGRPPRCKPLSRGGLFSPRLSGRTAGAARAPATASDPPRSKTMVLTF